MRSAVAREGAVLVRDDVPDPRPGPGQILVAVEACGICGSDLHFVRHGREMERRIGEMKGLPELMMRPSTERDVFMGHEFSARVLELGPGADGPAAGTLVTSIPALVDGNQIRDLAYSNDLPGGYSERMLLSAVLALEVPNGLDARRAALTEPMAVGQHAVNRADVQAGDGAVVVGCGPVGLAVVAALRRRGDVEPILAADFSPTRRRLAEAMGAHRVVDPASEDVFDAWATAGGFRRLVAFEAVGVPGMIDSMMNDLPAQSRLVVAGVCMQEDSIVPLKGIAKELAVQFVLGYTPEEFASCLRAIAEGDLDVEPLITGEVDLAGLPQAFADLSNPELHCKILCRPAGGPV